MAHETPAPIHHAAAGGYATAADAYVRGRPGYPPALADWLRDELRLTHGATAVDLGAGTGKFTPYLTATGAKVIAVEPVAAMLARLAADLPQVEARAGTATALPLADGAVDAVVCAQAFHWFATPEALAEIRRVLRPGGRLGLVWNMRDARVPWVARLDAIVNRREGDAPRFYTGAWRRAFPCEGYGALHERRFAIGHVGAPADVILARVRSTSFIAALPEAARARVDDEVRALIASEPELAGREQVTVPYETEAFWCEKLS